MSEMDSVYQNMKDDIEIDPEDEKCSYSQIRDFYTGQTILLTGSTGFMGKCLVEKLLRTCTGLEKIYTIVRMKRQRSIEERMKTYFDNPIFDKLRETVPDFSSKLIPIHGDISLPGAGLSPEDRQVLIDETTLIIHNASTVNFYLKISKSLTINVLGTQRLLELATECRKLKAFLYVSTAYSQIHTKYIEEVCYPPPLDTNMVHDIIRLDSEYENLLSPAAKKQLVDTFGNTYVLTKAVAESVVEEYAKKVDFPCAIFRPSTVMPTWKEPIAGWCDNYNGPVAPSLTYALGIAHVYLTSADKDNALDLIPADMTINGLLTSIWDLTTFQEPKKKCVVYNYTISALDPHGIRWFVRLGKPAIHTCPSTKMVWFPCSIDVSNYTVFLICHYLFHFLPCVIADLVLLCRGQSPRAVSLFLHRDKEIRARQLFMNRTWKWEMTNMLSIWDKMNPLDNREFFCDLRKIDWEDFFQIYWPGMRAYVLREPITTLPAARRWYRKLKIAHYTVTGVLAMLVIYWLYIILSYLFAF